MSHQEHYHGVMPKREPYKPQPVPQASGFPSPATEYTEYELDLNQLLAPHPAATEIFRFCGHHGGALAIENGDLIILDRSRSPRPGQLVVRERRSERYITRFAPQDREHPVLATVTWVVKKMCPKW